MAKEFNITGTCTPTRHYMADTSDKLKQVLAMVERGRYFIINRPRQYGKTTTLFLLTTHLNNTREYLAIKCSFEGVGDVVFEDETHFAPMFINQLAKGVQHIEPELSDWLDENSDSVDSLKRLSGFIATLVEKSSKKIVVLIDEVDKSSNNQLFVSFLAMLRNKYLLAAEERDLTFHSVVLAGVHDVKTLKLKLRPDEERKYNSPWNIATDFTVDMALQPHEIQPMLHDYMQERGVSMDAPAIADELFYYTSGYPFLVSKLCKMLDEETLPKKQKKEWTKEDLADAVSRFVLESNTNFDSLIKNLEDWDELYKLVYDILLNGKYFAYNIHDPVIYLGFQYGIFLNGQGMRIHNRIYQEVILNYMSSKTNRQMTSQPNGFPANFRLPGNRLDMVRVLTKFQDFMQEQYSRQDRDFLERNGRLVFLAFLKPIINGGGYDFKEVQISEEKRLDVVITFYEHKYIAELKIWHGEAAHKNGLKQLSAYLDRQNLQEGYLLIFDHSATKTWKKGWVKTGGKRVYAAWV